MQSENKLFFAKKKEKIFQMSSWNLQIPKLGNDLKIFGQQLIVEH